MVTRGSQLILVSTDLYNRCEFSGLITSNTISTFEINANTSLLSLLNWLINFRASLTYIFSHDFTPMLLLSFKRSALNGARLTARKFRVTAACGVAPWSSVLRGWLLLRLCGWLLSLFCCSVSAAGCCHLFCCTWRLAAAPFLRLAAACRTAALNGCCCPVPAAGCYPSFSESTLKRLVTFGTVSMDVLRLDYHASDTT